VYNEAAIYRIINEKIAILAINASASTLLAFTPGKIYFGISIT
jgi:hypothetical protein